MVKFYHTISGNEMWVAEDRVDEYKAAGHKPAAEVDAKPEADKPAPKAKATRKRSK